MLEADARVVSPRWLQLLGGGNRGSTVHIVVRRQNPGYPDRMQSDAALRSLSAGRERSRSGRRRPPASGCPGSERRQTSASLVGVLGAATGEFLSPGCEAGRVREAHADAGDGPSRRCGHGVYVRCSGDTSVMLLCMSDTSRNGSEGLAMRHVIDLTRHNAKFVFCRL